MVGGQKRNHTLSQRHQQSVRFLASRLKTSSKKTLHNDSLLGGLFTSHQVASARKKILFVGNDFLSAASAKCAAMDIHHQQKVQRPEFIRLPKGGTRCPFTGLSRSKLNQLVLPCKENGFKPPVESKVLRNRGAIRGTRLIVFDSLINYLRSI